MDQGRWSVVIAATLGLAIMMLAWAVAYSSRAEGSNNSLPSTNLSADGTVDRSSLPRPAPVCKCPRRDHPQARMPKRSREKTCIACHQLEADHFTHTLHSLGLHVANRSDPTIPVCEACHATRV